MIARASVLSTTPKRSTLMKSVGRKDTAPERVVRRYLHRHGLRFRLHVKRLPGTPDIVLSRYRTAIFVHGCFWHGHDCAHGSVRAKTNSEYWRTKIVDNRARDRRKAKTLGGLGWIVQTIWECETTDAESLRALVAHVRRGRTRSGLGLAARRRLVDGKRRPMRRNT